MLKYKVGDLIKAIGSGEVDVFAHQANCFNTMKSGIAPKLSEEFPPLSVADNSTVKGSRHKLGSYSNSTIFIGDRVVTGFNLYGQYHCIKNHPEYGTIYSALEEALFQMRDHLDYCQKFSKSPDHYKKIGIPLIGCGLAGGDWGVVSKFVEKAFDGYNGQVTVYTLKEVEGLDYDK